MRKLLFTITIAIVAAQCSPVVVNVSREDMDNLSEYSVKGRNGILINQKLSFGNYYTTDVNRSWTKGNDLKFGVSKGNITTGEYLNVISMEYINRKQTIRFNMAGENAAESAVFCVSKFKARELTLGDPSQLASIGIDMAAVKGDQDQNMFYAQVHTPGSTQPWQLVVNNGLAQQQAKTYKGLLSKSKTDYYTIVPITSVKDKNGKAKNLLAGSLGYEFRNTQGVAVAAVSLVDNGMVYLDNMITPEERFLLANACAALLLQQVIES